MNTLLERLSWVDPLTGLPLEVIVGSRNPWGKAITGALKAPGQPYGYPIVRGVPRLTPELANVYADWLKPFSLVAPGDISAFQTTDSVRSFGVQWAWDSEPRTDQDLEWRILSRHGLSTGALTAGLVLDAGCGAGDQSRWIRKRGSPGVVSVDLSDAVEVAAQKGERDHDWVVAQADATKLPLASQQFAFVYCEGVLQHTRDTKAAITELIRVTQPRGQGVATHYSQPKQAHLRFQLALRNFIRQGTRSWTPDEVLLLSGVFAAWAMVPGFRYLIGNTLAVKNRLMPGFKATWSCTYDTYGCHSFQRHITAEEFIEIFESIGVEAKAGSGGGILFQGVNPA